MEENKKPEEPESSDNTEKIEVKVNVIDDSDTADMPAEDTLDKSNDDVVASSETSKEPTEDPETTTEVEDTMAEPKVEESSAAQDELVPPPASEESSENQDEEALEEAVPAVEEDHSDSGADQLAPVAAPPQENQVVPAPDLLSAAIAPVGVAATQQAVEAHPHRNNKKLAVLITIFVGAMLASVAVYVYMSANSNTKEATPSPSPTPQQSTEQKTAEPATTDDLDATTGEVDQAIDSLDDASDFPEESLSDGTLGL